MKCWNANSDKTEFRCKDNIEISAVTGKIDQFILHAPVKFYSICKYHVNQLQVTVKDILHGKCLLEVMLKVTLEKV